MRYIYGPVKSRRLNHSLGVNLVSYKVCPFDCVYCQLKKTSDLTLARKEYVKASAILSEIKQFLKNRPKDQELDYITLSGSGESLLNSKINKIIQGIKKMTSIPVAVITDSALLSYKRIRNEILDCDIILPSLDAVTQDVFEKIDRPHKSLKISDIIEGLICLRKEFKGQIWLEVMIIKDINDDYEYIKRFKEVISKIKPDRIQLNSVARPPSESWVKSPSPERLKKIQALLGNTCELV